MRISKFVVHRDEIGSLKHALYDSGKSSWIDDLATPEWIFDCDEGSVDKCLKTLLRVNGVQVEYSPGAVQQKVYGKLLPASVKHLPWSLCLPAVVYKESVKNFLKAISMMEVETSYYDVGYRSFRNLVSKLTPFRVNEDLMRNAFDNGNDSLVAHVESLLPSQDGFVHPPKYNFFGTRTGRLTVSSGPMVLTLPKDQRNLFMPSNGSRIVQIDFSSLEPRLLIALAGLPAPESDLYEEISRTCFSGKLSRDKTKVALLGILYGMSVDTLSEHIGMPTDECRTILSTVKKHFRIKEILSRIEKTTIENISKNFFGRVIEINRSSILNNYVQSSGVDVVHIGFDKLLQDIEFMGIGFKPMFLIHDALVGEVKNDSFASLKKIVDRGFFCSQLDRVFPMTIGDFAKTTSNMEQ